MIYSKMTSKEFNDSLRLNNNALKITISQYDLEFARMQNNLPVPASQDYLIKMRQNREEALICENIVKAKTGDLEANNFLLAMKYQIIENESPKQQAKKLKSGKADKQDPIRLQDLSPDTLKNKILNDFKETEIRRIAKNQLQEEHRAAEAKRSFLSKFLRPTDIELFLLRKKDIDARVAQIKSNPAAMKKIEATLKQPLSSSTAAYQYLIKENLHEEAKRLAYIQMKDIDASIRKEYGVVAVLGEGKPPTKEMIHRWETTIEQEKEFIDKTNAKFGLPGINPAQANKPQAVIEQAAPVQHASVPKPSQPMLNNFNQNTALNNAREHDHCETKTPDVSPHKNSAFVRNLNNKPENKDVVHAVQTPTGLLLEGKNPIKGIADYFVAEPNIKNIDCVVSANSPEKARTFLESLENLERPEGTQMTVSVQIQGKSYTVEAFNKEFPKPEPAQQQNDLAKVTHRQQL